MATQRTWQCSSWLPCSKDALVKMWDVKGGGAVATLHGHKGGVTAAAWNDNGNWLLTAARDATLKVLL